jgi:2-oxoglutarate dehydrogenase E1 component
MTIEPTAPNHLNLAYLESLYADYQRDPASVPPEWQRYFEAMANGESNGEPPLPNPAFKSYSVFNPPPTRGKSLPQSSGPGGADLQERVDTLVRSYRTRGHLIAQLDPLQQPKTPPPELDPAYHDLTEADMDRKFACATMEPNVLLPLREIIERLRNTYCRSIGVQFMHIDDLGMRLWLQEQIERSQNRLALSRAQQLRILTRLTDAVTFEEFIRKKFVGAKS